MPRTKAEKIPQAHENPNLCPDLIVRVTGFTVYSQICPENSDSLL
ncbi:MAG: hypothetical protein KAJ05_07860 [Candidatus Latescibacteria bacterium]|nr:hypothetical protein [Candidatus Latescibacterota bacterium]MCK5527048.1 hypothetical protein [Candidatus Latescibacterota bacterium]